MQTMAIHTPHEEITRIDDNRSWDRGNRLRRGVIRLVLGVKKDVTYQELPWKGWVFNFQPSDVVLEEYLSRKASRCICQGMSN